jgi:hypothetical protein
VRYRESQRRRDVKPTLIGLSSVTLDSILRPRRIIFENFADGPINMASGRSLQRFLLPGKVLPGRGRPDWINGISYGIYWGGGLRIQHSIRYGGIVIFK